MPIYEYECQKCGHDLEALQQVSEPPLKTCPECGGELKKLLSAPAFQFKGSGWYVTDYAGKNGDGAGKEAKDSGKESGKEGAGPSPSADKGAKKETKATKATKAAESGA